MLSGWQFVLWLEIIHIVHGRSLSSCYVSCSCCRCRQVPAVHVSQLIFSPPNPALIFPSAFYNRFLIQLSTIIWLNFRTRGQKFKDKLGIFGLTIKATQFRGESCYDTCRTHISSSSSQQQQQQLQQQHLRQQQHALSVNCSSSALRQTSSTLSNTKYVWLLLFNFRKAIYLITYVHTIIIHVTTYKLNIKLQRFHMLCGLLFPVSQIRFILETTLQIFQGN